MGRLNFRTLDLIVKSLTVDGFLAGIRTEHDALYKWAPDMRNAAGATEVTTDAPRWTFPAAGTSTVTFLQEFPTTWTSDPTVGEDDQGFIGRMPWSKEAVGAGNVVWRFSYRFVNIVGGNFLGAKTDLVHAPIAVPGTVGEMTYTTDMANNVPILPGFFFGDAPQLVCAVSRLGDDAGDTYLGAAALYGFTFTRTSL